MNLEMLNHGAHGEQREASLKRDGETTSSWDSGRRRTADHPGRHMIRPSPCTPCPPWLKTIEVLE